MAKKPRFESDDAPLTSNPFASLLGATSEGAGASEATTPPSDSETSVGTAPAESKTGPQTSRVVVRRQKKGQGGKTVTYIEGLDAATAAAWMLRLKRELGCSARSRDEVLVAGTGDHERVAAWLRNAGASNVVLGN